jgi:hypothetical protein
MVKMSVVALTTTGAVAVGFVLTALLISLRTTWAIAPAQG